MYILGLRADQVTSSDIERLVQNQIKETKGLDYKKELSLAQDKDKKEFIFDITSMANTDGGCLVYGIEEKKDEKGQNTGVPEKIIGIAIQNEDKLFQQIEDLIKGNTEPSITNVILNCLIVGEFQVLVIGIPKALGLPVMTTFNESNKFYKRRNSGKYSVDVYELNQMFMQNQVLKESAEKFRLNRISKVLNGMVFPSLNTETAFFIHIIPYDFMSDKYIDISNAKNMKLSTLMHPMHSGGWDSMFNADGFAAFSIDSDRRAMVGYSQFFRNGIYEIYSSKLFQSESFNGQQIKTMQGRYFIEDVIEKINAGFKVLEKFQVEPPFLICISLHNILGAVINNGYEISGKFMVEELFLPPTVIENYQSKLYATLKINFDMLWQAVGYARSPEFTT